MLSKKSVFIFIAVLIAVALFTFKNSYNNIQAMDEKVIASWSEVANQYQRRADLVPNLVNTVKGYTQHEQALLTQITEARARVGQIHITPDQLADEAKVKQFQQAQNQLGSSLSRLLAVSENYPDLKSNTLFQDLMTQLEGTENRITVARGRYVTAIQEHNTYIRQFPAVLIANAFGYTAKPNFAPENEAEIAKPQKVEFN